MTPLPAFGFALFTLVAAPAFDADAYAQLTYDHEVAAHCGLLTPAVAAAYRQTRNRLEAVSALPPETLRNLRIKAIAAAAREYDNRGLGGHRGWCAGEGAAGVARILRSP